MKKKVRRTFYERDINDNTGKIYDKIHNQSIEFLQTEDIFINQKEEIKKINKRRFEIRKNTHNFTKGINLKCVQIRKGKKFNTLNNLNLTETNKIERKDIKSNSIKNKNLINRIKKITKNNNPDIKTIKLKLDIPNFDKDIKEDKEKKINSINIENNTNDEEKSIIDYKKDIIINSMNEIDFISLNNISEFQKCDCIVNEQNFNDIYDNENNYDEIPNINEKWTNIIHPKINAKVNIPNIKINPNFDFSKTVLITKNAINYKNKGVKINLHLKIYDNGSFWIFTRSYVDDYIPETKKYKTIDVSSRNINENNDNKIFSKYSTVIKIIKNKNSNKAFVTFGTFYINKRSGHIHYKTFLKRQLVDYVHEDNNYYYLENDLCEFDIIILDLGNEFLHAKISLNNREKFNNIKCNFYLPINKKAKLMFCGEGNNIKVSELEIKSFFKYDDDKEKIGLILSDERKACDCCSIF